MGFNEKVLKFCFIFFLNYLCFFFKYFYLFIYFLNGVAFAIICVFVIVLGFRFWFYVCFGVFESSGEVVRLIFGEYPDFKVS